MYFIFFFFCSPYHFKYYLLHGRNHILGNWYVCAHAMGCMNAATFVTEGTSALRKIYWLQYVIFTDDSGKWFLFSLLLFCNVTYYYKFCMWHAVRNEIVFYDQKLFIFHLFNFFFFKCIFLQSHTYIKASYDYTANMKTKKKKKRTL